MKTILRKLHMPLAALVAAAMLAACGAAPTPQSVASSGAGSLPPSSAPASQAAPGATQPTIEMLVQNYEYGNIKEIPQIVTGAPSETVDAINADILNFAGEYEPYITDNDGHILELKSYLFIDEQYVQIVMTRIPYPNYGTDGEVISFVYNWQADQWLSLDDSWAFSDVSANELEEAFIDGGYAGTGMFAAGPMEIAGFILVPDGVRYFVRISLNAGQDGDDWISMYSYLPAFGDFVRTHGLLFEAEEVLPMTPPLFCQTAEIPVMPAGWQATDSSTGAVVATFQMQPDGGCSLHLPQQNRTIEGYYYTYAMELEVVLEGWPMTRTVISSRYLYLPMEDGNTFWVFQPV